MIRFTFLKRLKARFRPTRPVHAPDTVIAAQVQDWIAEANTKTLRAALATGLPLRPLAHLDFDEQITPTLRLRITRFVGGVDRTRVPGAVVFRMTAGEKHEYLITVYEAPNVPATTAFSDKMNVLRAQVGDGKISVNDARRAVNMPAYSTTAHPDYAEIIRLANSLLRLAGAK